MLRAVGWIGIVWLLCPFGSSPAWANELGDYQERLRHIIVARILAIPHPFSGGGYVAIRIAIAPNGRVTRSKITQSSGRRDLDALALRIVPPGLTLPPLPTTLSHRAMHMTVPIRFVARDERIPDAVSRSRR
ncbi:energy transducer TonB family protein [Methylobacterium sp. Leaf118]|uniref:energy transducer TonB family protein n=1 Tax=Methylobacterium sp. Leaf118 TaxID=2876562 RepID=UPI001E40E8F9|nr:energy transducer TonB [Methylobacterium sp. Leaf118]